MNYEIAEQIREHLGIIEDPFVEYDQSNTVFEKPKPIDFGFSREKERNRIKIQSEIDSHNEYDFIRKGIIDSPPHQIKHQNFSNDEYYGIRFSEQISSGKSFRAKNAKEWVSGLTHIKTQGEWVKTLPKAPNVRKMNSDAADKSRLEAEKIEQKMRLTRAGGNFGSFDGNIPDDVLQAFGRHEAQVVENKIPIENRPAERIEKSRSENRKAVESSRFMQFVQQEKEKLANEIADGRIKARNEFETKQSRELYIESNNKLNEEKNQAIREEEVAKEEVARDKEKKRQKKELQSGSGPDNFDGYVSSNVGGGGSKSWEKYKSNEEKRFARAQRYYKQNLNEIEKIHGNISQAKKAFGATKKQMHMISDDSIGKIKNALSEAKEKYNQSVLDARRAGLAKPEFDDKKINDEIAKKVFGKSKKGLQAVEYARAKIDGEKRIKELQSRNNLLGRYIDTALEKDEKKIARGAKAKNAIAGGGWKGKAAIFGGIAASALAAVGVASMMMSGGRQENSNLYNPYQAMY